MVERFHPREIFLPYGIFLGIIIAAMVYPPLGAVAGIFTPVPLVLIYLQRGKVTGLITITGVAVILYIIVGPQMAITFVAAYGVLAAAMAETIRLGFSFEKTILFSALAPAVLALLLVFAGLGGKDTSLSDGLESAFKKEADKYIETLEKQQAKPEDLAALREYIDQTTPLLISIFPGFLIVCSLVAAVLNYLAVRYLRLKFYSGVYFQNADVSRWVLPDGMVWLLIFAVGSQFLGEGLPRTVGLNGALVLVTLYFFQGLAIVLHILKAKAFPRFVWVIVFALIALQPMMMGLVIGIGLFDIWLDFRKVRTTTPPLPKE